MQPSCGQQFGASVLSANGAKHYCLHFLEITNDITAPKKVYISTRTHTYLTAQLFRVKKKKQKQQQRQRQQTYRH